MLSQLLKNTKNEKSEKEITVEYLENVKMRLNIIYQKSTLEEKHKIMDALSCVEYTTNMVKHLTNIY